MKDQIFPDDRDIIPEAHRVRREFAPAEVYFPSAAKCAVTHSPCLSRFVPVDPARGVSHV